jgi:hypothetical protein
MSSHLLMQTLADYRERQSTTVRSRFLASGVAALVVTAVTACSSGSPPGTAVVSTASSRSQPASPSPAASPSADTPAATPSVQAGRPAACRTRDLGARYRAGGYATGNDFGYIEIWNPGPAPCRLAGTVTVAAFFANGTIDRNARIGRPGQTLAQTLPARMARPGGHADLSRYVVATLMASENVCRAQDELTPATLELSIGSVTFRVRNHDPAAPAGFPRGVYGCQGMVALSFQGQ